VNGSIDDLLENASAYEFFAALRLIEQSDPSAPPVGYAARPTTERHRLRHVPTLSFVANSIGAARTNNNRTEIDSQFLGLWGPQGPLPLHLTEYAMNRLRDAQDPTVTAFLDIFHHRILTLFYRAWADSQPQTNAERRLSDRFATFLGSFIGTGTADVANSDHFPDQARLRFVSGFARQRRDAEGLEQILNLYLQLPVRIEQFIGSWLEIPATELSRVGQQFSSLGHDATLGASVWHGASKIRICIGPLGLADFEKLLPDKDTTKKLIACVRSYLGDELDWEYQATLTANEVPQTELGGYGQLGWTTWLGSRNTEEPVGDAVLQPNLKSAVH
jgi:type VI secretion system protein ImpH